MNSYRADLHIHSRYSRATSKKLSPDLLAAWAQIKGLAVLGTGDFTHPVWRKELKEALRPDADNGLFVLKNQDFSHIRAEHMPWLESAAVSEPTRFILQAEISSIYKKAGRVRRIHNLVYVPDFETADKLCEKLSLIGNLTADGRPILGLDARDLLELVLETHPDAFMVPAHIWTPWFSLFGSKSGFDSVEECFGDLAGHIFAMETGLSSDPAMNRLWSALDRMAMISNSDAHSGDKLGREANIFSGRPSYQGILRALRSPDAEHRLIETLEFFPEEGKYHLDGHRDCQVVMDPEQTKAHKGKCPVCGKPVTVGVLSRVMALADRSAPDTSVDMPFVSLIPLNEILSEILGAGKTSRRVMEMYGRCLKTFSSELELLTVVPPGDLAAFFPPLAEAVSRMRANKVHRQPGFDGQFGVISLFSEQERRDMKGGSLLQGLPDKTPAGRPKAAKPKDTSKAVAAKTTSPGLTGSPPKNASAGQNYSPAQSQAFESSLNPMLVLAGPGTGKTHTLIGRVLRLLESNESPRHILAVTFSRRAAEELKSRLHDILGDRESTPRADTLHALAFEQWLQAHGEPPTVLSEEAAWRVFGEANQDQPQDRLRAAWTSLLLSRERREALDPALITLAERYTKTKESWNLVDYTDLLEFWLGQIENKIFVCPYTHVLVDEVQDMTTLQMAIITRLLPEEGRGFFAIGDPRQSIYAFRGASGDAQGIIQARWPNLTTLSLRDNYRSSQNILDLAASLFPGSEPLKAAQGPSVQPALFEAQTQDQEAAWIAHHINDLLGPAGHSLLDGKNAGRTGTASLTPGDIAILVRFKALIGPLNKTLFNHGLLCSVPETEAFWHDPRIAVLLANIGRTLGISQAQGVPELDCPDKILTADPITIAAKLQLVQPFDQFFWQSAAFKELKQAYKTQGNWLAVLNWINLQTDVERIKNRGENVQIITLHGSKGLEFNTIFMPALEDGILPFNRKKLLAEQSGDNPDLEEEKRLFYVGLTRARERLYLSWARNRQLYGRTLKQRPSSFLADLPKDQLKASAMVVKTEQKEKQMSLL